VPGLEPTRLHWLLVSAITVAAILTLMGEPARANIPLSQFIKTGMGCARSTIFYASLPWLALLLFVRRGAPLARGATGALIDAASLPFTYGLMRVKCPMDERYHLFVWHLMPGLIAIGLSVFVRIGWLRSPGGRIARREN
jgi:Negative regulator of sigma F